MNGDNLRDSNQNEAQEPNTQQNSRKTIIWEYVLGLPLLPGIPGKRNTTHRSKSFTNHYWQISQCWHPRTCFFFFFFSHWYWLKAAILVFAFASTISVEQPVLVCSVVWELLSVRRCQSTGAVLWSDGKCMQDTTTTTALITKCVPTVKTQKLSGRLAIFRVKCQISFLKLLPFLRHVVISFSWHCPKTKSKQSLRAPGCKCLVA